MDHAVVQKWLRSVLGPYTDRDRVFADIDRTLIAVSSLSPKTEVFTFNDGRTQLLLNLDGTIPVNFRGNTYNIPVAYWIPRDYPREPPMAFVAPTPDMAIRKGPNVDPSGEIGGEYLRRWRNKPEACNLLDLVHDCQQMFGREPPVYAKPKPTPVYATAASTSAAAQQRQPSQPSTPQRQASVSHSYAQQRPGPPPPVPASPQSLQSAGGAIFHGRNGHDPRQKPPPPAPATPTNSQGGFPQGHGQTTPHRPPKPSSSLGPDGGYSANPHPRDSMSYSDQYGSPAPAPLPGTQMQSPQQTGAPRFAPNEEAYRRSSGAGLPPAGYGRPPQQYVGPHQQQYASQSPAGGPQSPAQTAPWQSNAYDPNGVPAQRRDSQQFAPHHQHHNQHQRAQTYPYPASDSHRATHSPYNGSPAPPRQNGQPPYQPQHGPSSTQSPLAPGPHPYQHAINSAAGANGHSNSPTPAIVPKPKGFNLLDEEDDSSVHPHTSSAGPAPGNPSVAPPPRPINPELLALHDRLYHKIDSRLTTLSSTLSASNARLDVLSADLDRGLPAIEDELSRLKAVRDVCATTGDRLQTSVTELTDQVRSLQSREDPDPDTMVLATSIVGNQLVDLVAEDNAIEDTLYHLGRALNAERIDLEKFLKQTRVLAREQFMKRALAMKIGEGMGWA
ncbi:Ubiquitin E2 variant, N-terminal [Kalmanozyma brasiliensis GHG001]|uniref:Ubiquitin E2 variant, N-terminal n=1 Tax=Kalmanozyma brasiliensis (strain GHG001) TaxID=1365824 RepID=UPI002867EE9D|nr:Ubiquitin E2 variant, N-terminal [Kalmanozyma brasiliensis GHG001]EST05126.2 Ubiquitin E2 variant, N-terminal [Kalmanozyma brasiliensis GHG001]